MVDMPMSNMESYIILLSTTLLKCFKLFHEKVRRSSYMSARMVLFVWENDKFNKWRQDGIFGGGYLVHLISGSIMSITGQVCMKYNKIDKSTNETCQDR